MDEVPNELLHYIFHYIDQLPDLIRASLVCQRWQSSIMNNDYFLNKWFHRLLKRCRRSTLNDPLADSTGNRERRVTQIIDQSLFPLNLQSSECYLLPTIDPFHPSDDSHFFEYRFPPSLFTMFHSFSFWIFLPRECELAIQVGYHRVLGLNTCIYRNRRWNFGKREQIVSGDRWTHIAMAKIVSDMNYHVWINGEEFRELDLPMRWNRYPMRSASRNGVLLSCKCNSYSIRSPIRSRIADLAAFERCLSVMEIRAIYEQQTSIDQVRVGNYMASKTTQRSNNDQPLSFGSFSCKCATLLCLTVIAIVGRQLF